MGWRDKRKVARGVINSLAKVGGKVNSSKVSAILSRSKFVKFRRVIVFLSGSTSKSCTYVVHIPLLELSALFQKPRFPLLLLLFHVLFSDVGGDLSFLSLLPPTHPPQKTTSNWPICPPVRLNTVGVGGRGRRKRETKEKKGDGRAKRKEGSKASTYMCLTSIPVLKANPSWCPKVQISVAHFSGGPFSANFVNGLHVTSLPIN